MRFVSGNRRIHAVALAIAVVGLLMALPAAGSAGTVTTFNGLSPVRFSALEGETNTLTVVSNPGLVRITDTSSPVTEAESNCESDGPATVVCYTELWSYWTASLGDQNDSLTAEGSGGSSVSGDLGDDRLVGSNDNTSPESLGGGEGNDSLDTRNAIPSMEIPGLTSGDNAWGDEGDDVLTGGNGDDFVWGGDGTDAVGGGDGDDVVLGGRGADAVAGGAGDDHSTDGRDGDDSYDGGPGIDVIDFLEGTFDPGVAPDAYAVDLIAGFSNLTNNAPSSNAVVNFEDVSTTGGADTVIGGDGPNLISSGAGNDVVNPRSGGDVADTGAGDDSADSVDGYGDRVNCEAGNDTLRADQFDTHANCESVTVAVTRPAGADVVAPVCSIAGVKSRYRVKVFKRGVTARVSCNEGAAIEARLVAVLKRGKGGRVVAARVGDLVLAEQSAPLGSTNVSLKLKPSRLASGLGNRFRVRVVIDASDEFGNRTQIAKRVSVKSKTKKKKATCKKKKRKGSKACKRR